MIGVSMLKIGTLFSGIGAIENALKEMGIEHEIAFACDNGERELDQNFEELKNEINVNEIKDIQQFIKDKYSMLSKKNLVKESYFANYDITEDKWYEDVRFLDGTKYRNQLDLIVGGSPCQSFSTYGKRLGLEDTRGTLFYDYARIVSESQPKAFIYENVTGLMNHDKGRTWEVIQAVFDSLDYSIQHAILDAKDYGLPQTRRRVFVVGIKKGISSDVFEFPNTIKLEKKVEDFLDEIVPNKYYLPFKGFRYVTEASRNEGRARVNREIMGCQTANQQFNWTGDFRVEKALERHIVDERIFKGYYKEQLSVARKLTPQECLRLMGFNDFKIVVNDQTMYRQCGNSIATPVLKQLVESLKKFIY